MSRCGYIIIYNNYGCVLLYGNVSHCNVLEDFLEKWWHLRVANEC